MLTRRKPIHASATEVAIDQIELFPGKGIVSVDMSGDFEYTPRDGWRVERLYMVSSKYVGARFNEEGEPAPVWINDLVRIDDDPEFRVFVRAAERWAEEHLDESEHQ